MIPVEEFARASVRFIADQGGRGGGLVADKKFQKDEIVCVYSKTAQQANDVSGAQLKQRIAYAADAPSGIKYEASPMDIGGLINDPIAPAFINALRQCRTASAVALWVQHYSQRSQFRPEANVTIEETNGEGSGLFVKTLQEVGRNDPLWFSYGPLYWLEALSLDESAPISARLAVIAFFIVNVQKSAVVCSSPAIMWLPDPPLGVCLSPKLRGHDLTHCQVLAFSPLSEKLTQRYADQVCGRWLTLLGLPNGGYAEWATALHSVKITEFLYTATTSCEPTALCPHCARTGAMHDEPHVAAYAYQRRAGAALMCAVCARGRASYCGSCRSEAYCSKKCQKAAWAAHKSFCAAHKALRATLERIAPLK